MGCSMARESVEFNIQANEIVQCADNTQTVLNLSVNDTLDISVELVENTSGILVINVEGIGRLNLVLNCLEGSSFDYLWVNKSDTSLVVNETVYLGKQASLRTNYGEMTSGEHEKTTVFHMIGERSVVDVRSASITFNKMSWDMSVEHEAKYTEANLRNYAIGLENSEFVLKVIGHILNGNSGSQTHQTSRVLNVSDKITAVVYPELLIDENDVAASHACTMGQPDPEQVYYLQARGLPEREAFKLITLG